MSTNKDEILQKQKEDYEKLAQETFNSILAAYRLVVNEIRDDSFDIINKTISKEMHKTLENPGSAFKEHLFQTIKDRFTKIWKDRDMDCNVAMLELSKKCFLTNEKWRPSDKTAEEQLRPHLIKMLHKERDLLRKQIEVQKEKIATYIPILEENRRIFSQRMQQRAEVLAEIEKDMQSIEEHSEKIDRALDLMQIFNE